MADIETVDPAISEEEEAIAETEDIFIDSSEVGDAKVSKAEPEPTKEPAPVEEKQTDPDWLDPVFKAGGKTTEEAVKEQAKSYKEAVKKWQGAAQEAAEHRKLIDSYILDSINKNPALSKEERQEIKKSIFEEELGLDGEKVRDSLIQSLAPVLKPLYDAVTELKGKVTSGSVREAVLKVNPDHFEVVQTPEFADWAVKNYTPKIIQLADSDPDIAADIVSRFKESRKAAEKPVTVAPVTTKPQFTETSKAPVGDKVWKRSELIKMQNEHPDEYAANQKEILRAYAEGRIK